VGQVEEYNGPTMCLVVAAGLIDISRRWGWARYLPGGWPDGGFWSSGGKWKQ